LSFFGAFVAFLVVGQIGLWATGVNLPPIFASPWASALDPFMFVLYTLTGLLAAYFAYKAAGVGRYSPCLRRRARCRGLGRA
jgi:hypothetical protein